MVKTTIGNTNHMYFQNEFIQALLELILVPLVLQRQYEWLDLVSPIQS